MATGITRVQAQTKISQHYIISSEDTADAFAAVLVPSMEEFTEQLIEQLPIGANASISVVAKIQGEEIPVEFEYVRAGEEQ